MLNRIKILKPLSPYLHTLFVAVLISNFPSKVSAEVGGYQVSGVEIVGNQRVDTEAIKIQIKKRSGTITTDEISENVKSLFKTGFFDQVNASIVPKDGTNILQFSVVEKPLVRKVFVKGNDAISESDLSEIVKFGDQRFLDKARIDTLKRAIVAFYESRGYNSATVEQSVVPTGDNQVDLTFAIKEGRKYKLRKIEFKGINKIESSDLRDLIQTKRYKWYSSWLFGTGRIAKEQLEADRTLIRQYFLDHGLIEGTVGDPIVSQDDATGDMTLTFEINEGKEYKVGKVVASGDLIQGGIEKTLEDTKSKSGEVFSAASVRDDSFKVSEKFGDLGYAFANVTANTDVHQEAGTVDLDFVTSKGKVVSINRINIHGNDKTYDNVIRREMKVQEQDQYSGSKIKRSQELLQRLGFFEEVNIANQPITGQDNKTDLNVNVREAKSTGSFSIGAGYSTSDGALANARLTENNILGTGRKLDLNVDVGTQRNNATLSLTDPRLNDTKLAVGAELLRAERKFNDFDRVLTGGALSAGYPLDAALGEWAEDISANARYELVNVDIRNIDEKAATLVKNSEGTSVSSAITPSLNRNTINNPLNPRIGSNQVLSYERSGLGGDEEYSIATARNTLYYPMFDSFMGEFVFSDRTRFDYGESLNNDPFPLFKRFFPGGINSVRGYGNRSLGPREGDREYGGAKEFINNAEVIFPLVNSAGIKGVVFYDIGNAFDDNESVDFSQMRKSWGLGIRWLSPLGPLRLEFGFPIARQPGEDRTVPMFSFGAPF